MEKDEVLEIITYSIECEEPAFISPLDAEKINVSDVLDGSIIEIGLIEAGTRQITLEGQITKENGELFIDMQHNWYRKYWNNIIGMPYFMDLMKRLVEFRKIEFGDVDNIEFEDEGDWCHLNYKIIIKDALTLKDAYKYGLEVNNWVEDIVNRAERNVGSELIKIQNSYSTLILLELPDLLKKLNLDNDSNEKGKLLEELMSKFFSSINGFVVSQRVRTETEEIDLVILNSSNETIWQKESQIILVECKNWSSKCGKNELVLFKEKLRNRRNRAKLGFFISWNGFYTTFNTEDLRTSQNDELIIPVSGKQIVEAIDSGNIENYIKQWWFTAVNS